MKNDVQTKISWKSDWFLVSASVFSPLRGVVSVELCEENLPSHGLQLDVCFLGSVASRIDHVIVQSQLQRGA